MLKNIYINPEKNQIKFNKFLLNLNGNLSINNEIEFETNATIDDLQKFLLNFPILRPYVECATEYQYGRIFLSHELNDDIERQSVMLNCAEKTFYFVICDSNITIIYLDGVYCYTKHNISDVWYRRSKNDFNVNGKIIEIVIEHDIHPPVIIPNDNLESVMFVEKRFIRKYVLGEVITIINKDKQFPIYGDYLIFKDKNSNVAELLKEEDYNKLIAEDKLIHNK